MGKSVNSHKLPYSKPRIITELPGSPKAAELVDPVSYIKFWDKYNHGEPVDISKAKKMTRTDFMKADPRGIELMLAYGVTQKQITMQYNTPQGSLTAIFKRLDVNTKVESMIEQHFAVMDLPEHMVMDPTVISETAEEDTASTLSETEESPTEEPVATSDYSSGEGPEISDQLKEAINELFLEDTAVENNMPDYAALYQGYTWYSGNVRQTEQLLTVFGDGRFSLSSGIRKIFQGYLVVIGLSPDGMRVVIAPNENSTYLIKPEKSRYRNPRLIKAIAGLGIPLPAKYIMTWEPEKQVWEGSLAVFTSQSTQTSPL